MDYAEKELFVSRIVSGTLRCNVIIGKEDCAFILKPVDRDIRYIANELYFDTLRESELCGVFSDDEMLSWMVTHDVWNLQKEERLDGLVKDIEEIKVKLFQLTFNSTQRYQIKTKLQEAKEEVEELEKEKHSYDFATCKGVASSTKMRFIVGCSLYYPNSEPYWDNAEDGWEMSDATIDKIIDFCSRKKIGESELRELARTDPWLSMWNSCVTARDVFGVFASDMNAEQQSLLNWTMLYKNIKEHPNCPLDTVIEDDDILDGWLILQRRKHETDSYKKAVDDKLKKNQKISEAHEVFLPADTQADANKIDKLNDPAAMYIKKKRMAILQSRGKVSELEMPDTAQRLQTEVTQLFSKSIKQRKGNGK